MSLQLEIIKLIMLHTRVYTFRIRLHFWLFRMCVTHIPQMSRVSEVNPRSLGYAVSIRFLPPTVHTRLRQEEQSRVRSFVGSYSCKLQQGDVPVDSTETDEALEAIDTVLAGVFWGRARSQDGSEDVETMIFGFRYDGGSWVV